ncbi:protein WVD2-like 7 isoform X1 [Iris pallida]|uniref:Protein WVD2-like 7 isoform X1 n=1 Tax=Iris pallida TaxID=29817 RepID=A0AAX6IK61_IRIPA|nr:protein WVD2-like 7 isoform X1 [Iris pallida]
MAGETEDCLSYQADLLPTGSISFGRYEVESLSWERRSSFSHNRYLEEVEKCSTPGSVTQKRAILEAHFKKKPLVPQTSLEHHDEVEYEATKDRVEQETCRFKELVDNDNGHPEFAWYHDTPAGSDETEIMEGEEEENSMFEHISYNDEKVLHPSSELSDLDETLEPQAERLTKPSNKDNLRVVVELEPDNKAVIVEELLEKREDIIVEEESENREDIVVEKVHENRGISSRSSKVESKNVNSLKKTQKASLKVNEAIELKPAKIKRTQLPVQQNQRNSSTKRSSVSSVTMRSKSVEKEERDNTLTTKSVKQSPSRTSMTTSFDSKNLKLEPSQILVAKVGKERRSVKDVQLKKGVIKAHSISGKSELGVHQAANRPKEIADSAKEEVNQSGSVFSFKCEERAERRKQARN